MVARTWAQALLARWRKALGLPPRTEIFPKQKRLVDATDTGNWLNMPFFSCYGKERGLRYAYDPDTGVAYEYRVVDENHYELCATFARRREADRDVFWNHPAGRHCFTFDVRDPP